MSINKVRAVWTNFPGAPGYTTVYSASPPTPTLGALRGLFDALKAYIPANTTITFPNSGDIIDETTGFTTGGWSSTTVANVLSTASASANYAGNAGACITWRTNNIVNKRRPLGRSYIVPLVSVAFDTNGSLSPAFLIAIQAAADAAITAAGTGFVIWSRPNGGRPGTTSSVTSASIADVSASLKSRRI
jgi:hypothetical protein